MPKKLKDLSVEALNERLKTIEAEDARIRPEYERLGKELTALYEKREAVKDELSRRIQIEIDPKNWRDFTSEQWEYVLNDANDQGMARYKFSESVFHAMGLWSSGYNPETNQRAVSMMLYRDEPDSKAQTLEALRVILPHIKPRKINMGYDEDDIVAKYVNVFEHGLSEYAVIWSVIDERTGAFYSMNTRYSRTKVEKKFDTLEELVSYIQREHYYQVTRRG
jgi:hypothetical protein